ncbi:MAG: sigma 54-interacting transcriptional regulator [Marinobacter sp.]|uniref:sigma-54 dependent transcriptional regulator n=1 Tax=Marinobacter sp. TaxID=50741 RepID=UPI00299D9870|nr:sigma 54-interacting transcriptional regulator [Marinobacter sp.]MDX1757207.1 sigma 54-interacting transcriptional regulator [Marinobacter sp.]
MEAKRTLLWLSPKPNQALPIGNLAPHWEIHRLNLNQPPRPIAQPSTGVRVGILDLEHYSTDSFPQLEDWLESLTPTSWVGLTARSPREDERLGSLIGTHCADYHTLPMDSNRLNTVLGHLWGMADLQARLADSQEIQLQQYALTGDSEAIRHTRALLHRFAETMEPVLIYGASGTGKEAAARYVHEHSPVNRGPFVAVNCAALPPSLTQSELFGYEKGAFTSASASKSGRLEAAHGGSLLLLGIDELLADQQSALLRFLQEGLVERIGGNSSRTIEARVIATSTHPLMELVESDQFRSDVYYRLGGLEVVLPLLRERLEDIPHLIDLFFASLPPPHRSHQGWRLSEAAMRALVKYDWPGNLRELNNRLRQATLLCDRPVLTPADLGFSHVTNHTPEGLSLDDFRARAEQQAVSCSLALTHNNVSAAARLLNISRVSMYRLMAKYHTQRGNVEALSPKSPGGRLP